MIILINGSFGVGKSTIAKLLRDALPGSSIYDPEWVGLILMRAGKWFKIEGSGTGDFQDIPLWRSSIAAGTMLIGRFASGPIIVPMTFSCRDYFDEVLTGLRRRGSELSVFCLRASLATIEHRLEKRRLDPDSKDGVWISRRIRECVEAHRDPHFGDPVDTESRTAREVADEILKRVTRVRS